MRCRLLPAAKPSRLGALSFARICYLRAALAGGAAPWSLFGKVTKPSGGGEGTRTLTSEDYSEYSLSRRAPYHSAHPSTILLYAFLSHNIDWF